MSNNTIIEFPNQETRNIWPKMYGEIVKEVKEPTTKEPFEERIRVILRNYLDMGLVKTDDKHRKFFKDVLRFAIDMDIEKGFRRVESGRIHYKTNGLKRDNKKSQKKENGRA